MAVEGLSIISGRKVSNIFDELKDIYYSHRFDNIAGAVQALVESTLIQLFSNASSELDVSNFYILVEFL